MLTEWHGNNLVNILGCTSELSVQNSEHSSSEGAKGSFDFEAVCSRNRRVFKFLLKKNEEKKNLNA